MSQESICLDELLIHLALLTLSNSPHHKILRKIDVNQSIVPDASSMEEKRDLSREFDRDASFPVKVEYDSLAYILNSLVELVCPGIPCVELVPPLSAENYRGLRDHLLSKHMPLHFRVDLRMKLEMPGFERLKLRQLSFEELLILPEFPRNYIVALLDRLNLLLARNIHEASHHIQYLVGKLDVPLKLAKEFYAKRAQYALFKSARGYRGSEKNIDMPSFL